MATIAYIDAAMDALVTHLQAALDAATAADAVPVVRGWPEEDQPSERGYAAVTHGRPTRTLHSPQQVGYSTDSGTVTVRFATGRWTCNVQIDVFTLHRDQRDELVPVVDEALVGGMPYSSNLVLTATDYHADKVRLEVVDEDRQGERDALHDGRYRHTFALQASGSVIRTVEYPEQSEIALRLTTGGKTETIEVS